MENNSSAIDIMNFFIKLQEKLQNIIHFIEEKNLLVNSEGYSKFITNSKKYLYEHNYDQYFLEWYELLIDMFMSVS